MIANVNENESENVAIETATTQVRPAHRGLGQQPADLETAATHTQIDHVLRLLNETLVEIHRHLRLEIATVVVTVFRLMIRAMQDIAAMALQNMMTGTMTVIEGGTIETAGIETEIGIGIEMVDTVRALAVTYLEAGKAEEVKPQEYNPQAHQDRIDPKEARAEVGQDRQMRWHSQRIAIGMRFGPCSEQWTRTVSDIEGIVNMEEG